MVFNVDTSNFSEIVRRKRFFSSVLKHLFYMIFYSCLSCCGAIYIFLNYHFAVWLSLFSFSVVFCSILTIMNNIFIIARKKEFIFFKPVSFLMGILFSPTVLMVKTIIVIQALIITTILFFALFMISKTINEEQANFFGILAMRMFFFYFVSFSILLLLALFGVYVGILDTFLSSIFGIALIFATIYDFKAASIIANNNDLFEDGDFLVAYCAYNLYLDYMHILYYMIRILIFIKGKKDE